MPGQLLCPWQGQLLEGIGLWAPPWPMAGPTGCRSRRCRGSCGQQGSRQLLLLLLVQLLLRQKMPKAAEVCYHGFLNPSDGVAISLWIISIAMVAWLSLAAVVHYFHMHA